MVLPIVTAQAVLEVSPNQQRRKAEIKPDDAAIGYRRLRYRERGIENERASGSAAKAGEHLQNHKVGFTVLCDRVSLSS